MKLDKGKHASFDDLEDDPTHSRQLQREIERLANKHSQGREKPSSQPEGSSLVEQPEARASQGQTSSGHNRKSQPSKTKYRSSKHKPSPRKSKPRTPKRDSSSSLERDEVHGSGSIDDLLQHILEGDDLYQQKQRSKDVVKSGSRVAGLPFEVVRQESQESN